LTLNSSARMPRIGPAGGPCAELRSRSLKLLASRHFKSRELVASKLSTPERGHVHHVLAFAHLVLDFLPYEDASEVKQSVGYDGAVHVCVCVCVCVCVSVCVQLFTLHSDSTWHLVLNWVAVTGRRIR